MYAQAPVLVTPPAATPVSLAEAKAHLRIDGNDEDVLVTALIAAAVAHLDGWSGILGRALVTQTWQQDLDQFPRDRIALPLAPVQSITSVGYRDTDGEEQTLDSPAYVLTMRAGTTAVERTDGAEWPSTARRPDAVRVTFVAGYGNAAAVPADIKSAILLMVGDLYAHRETALVGNVAAVPMSITVEALLAPYRRIGV